MQAKEMASPEPQPNQIWNFLATLVPWTVIYGAVHTSIYYVFKYFSESRDKKIEEAVDRRYELKVKPLEDKIDKLTTLFVQHIENK